MPQLHEALAKIAGMNETATTVSVLANRFIEMGLEYARHHTLPPTCLGFELK